MEWISDKVMSDYLLINKIVNNAIKQRYPNLGLLELGKESFNDLFNPERDPYELPKIDIIMCVDFTYSNDSDIGVLTMKYITNAFSSIIGEGEVFSNHKSIFLGEFLLNKTKYCKGIVPYTV
jgi:hypothetical protein